METRQNFKNKKRIVIKVGTSTLSYKNGGLNFRSIEKISSILYELRSRGYEITLVSSGAIGVGAGRVGLTEKPKEMAKKQALAAIGQAELMRIYQRFFDVYNQNVAQVLLTKDIMVNDYKFKNARNTMETLLKMGIIPIINENDTIATYEIEIGDNDTLSAMVAKLIQADLLILMSDIDGLYTADPKTDKNAKIISTVEEITPEIENLATGAGSSFGTGGMVTKITAAKICREAKIDTIITNGANPSVLFDILEGKNVGTHFLGEKLN